MKTLRGTITLFVLASLGAPLAYPLLTRMGSNNMAIAANSYDVQAIDQYTQQANPASIAQQSQQVIYVSPSGRDAPGAGSQAQPFRTITAALATNPAPGTVIQLAPGTYSEATGEQFPIKLKTGVELRGNGSSKGSGIVISGGGTFISPTFARQNIAILAANNAHVGGITITNANTRGYGLWVESSNNVTIANNTFTNNNHDGVFLTGTASALVVGNIFTKNGANGMTALGTSSGEIRENRFEDTGFGLTIAQKSRVVLSKNRILNNRSGIVMSDAVAPVLRGNLIANNNEHGVVILKTRNGQPTPDLGTTNSPGQNIIKNNRQKDINNASDLKVVAVGNEIDKSRISGPVELVAAAAPITPPPAVDVPVTPGVLVDISGHWAEAYIAAMAEQGIISGFGNGLFKPDEPVTRAQFAAILNKAFPVKPAVRPKFNFNDVPSNYWGATAIAEASAKGFLSGYGNGTFRPNANVSRMEILLALVNGWQMEGGGGGNLPNLFTDAAQLPEWAVQPIAAAVRNKLVINYPNKQRLEPMRSATRAEVAAMVYQAMLVRGKVDPIPSNYIAGQ
jgi:parallel beta-helix repeat protein